ncbi:hypothetical protein [Candidatus Pelagibacter communis]|uniref:hypothetical protein n=1 Tax=Pelagibacter ubique TaxID=198252 RepID=UPI00094D7C96|nr:hypothetical protein [Candidatus Pelagibacter ubique]
MNNIQHIILKNKKLNDVVVPKAYLENNEYNTKLSYEEMITKIKVKENKKKKLIYLVSTVSAIALIAASYS